MMELNCKQKYLEYVIDNKKKEKFGFKNIDFGEGDVVYNLAVALRAGDSVHLVAFQRILE